MKISEIHIEQLYGTYSYHIVNLQNQQLLVLTGYNGMGKTTILNIVKNISESNLWFFYELDFKKIAILFENKMSLEIESYIEETQQLEDETHLDQNINPEKGITYTWKNDGKDLCKLQLDRHQFYEAFASIFKSELYAEEDKNWIILMKDNMREVLRYICKKQHALSFEMLQASVKAFMIPAQRLKQIRKMRKDENRYPFVDDSLEEIDTIDTIAEKLARLLYSKKVDFLERVQRSKNSLMDRLLDERTEDLGKDEYESIAHRVKARIDDLKSFGISYEKVRPYDSSNGKLLSAYLLGLQDTLKEYTDVLNDLKLFDSILKEKQFLHKKVCFSPDYGLKVLNDKGVSISNSSLSSGEQNVIILLYRIIFEVQEAEILLIDEPEISMHVVWLKEFVEDLRKIAVGKDNLQILIATHSPLIVRGALEYTFDLEMKQAYGK